VCRLILCLLLMVLLPGVAVGETLEIEFAFTPDAGKNVASYKFFQDSTEVCDIPDNQTMSFLCDLTVPPGVHHYTMLAVYADETQSPLSPPYWFAAYLKILFKLGENKVRFLIDQDQ